MFFKPLFGKNQPENIRKHQDFCRCKVMHFPSTFLASMLLWASIHFHGRGDLDWIFGMLMICLEFFLLTHHFTVFILMQVIQFSQDSALHFVIRLEAGNLENTRDSRPFTDGNQLVVVFFFPFVVPAHVILDVWVVSCCSRCFPRYAFYILHKVANTLILMYIVSVGDTKPLKGSLLTN